MKIVDKALGAMELAPVPAGSCFRHRTAIWIRTNMAESDWVHCVELHTGRTDELRKSCTVTPVNAKVVVEC